MFMFCFSTCAFVLFFVLPCNACVCVCVPLSHVCCLSSLVGARLAHALRQSGSPPVAITASRFISFPLLAPALALLRHPPLSADPSRLLHARPFHIESCACLRGVVFEDRHGVCVCVCRDGRAVAEEAHLYSGWHARREAEGRELWWRYTRWRSRDVRMAVLRISCHVPCLPPSGRHPFPLFVFLLFRG